MKLVSVEEMRLLEQEADAAGHSYGDMMERAGLLVAGFAGTFLERESMRHALVLVGPGNNGGDGLVAAHYLREADCDVTLYLWRRDIKGDPNFARLKRRRRGVTILWADNDDSYDNLRTELRQTSLVIDALLGTGAARPIEGRLERLMRVVREEIAARLQPPAAPQRPPGLRPPQYPLAQPLISPLVEPPASFDDEYGDDDPYLDRLVMPEDRPPTPDRLDHDVVPAVLPVLAVDCPSGLNCDTGEIDPAAIPASITVTFAYPKWGQVQYPGAGACGLLAVVDIGIAEELGQQLPVELADADIIRNWLPARPDDAHKGVFGKVMVIGGSMAYTGAPILSAAAAARAGAGLITAAVPAPVHAASAGSWPEITWLVLPGTRGVVQQEGATAALARLKDYNALLIGPGLTTEETSAAFLNDLLDGLDKEAWQGRVVLDADALNLLARTRGWAMRLPPGCVLTPHPGEMSRLTGQSISDINRRRIATARRFAAEWDQIVLLKGPHTVIAHPDGRTIVLPFADPALAKAGSGDVLAGAILAMLGQGLEQLQAASAGAYVHGLSGIMMGRTLGAASVTARDLIQGISPALQQLQMVR